MKRLFFVLIAIVLVNLTSCNNVNNKQEHEAKYVFLFIGDGMGVNQVYLSELYLAAKNGKDLDEKMLFNQFPVQSRMTTYSYNNLITCSSASATAISTGHKTNNEVVCKSPDLQTNYETLGHKMKQAGYKVGILSTVQINHATPACFYAHQDSRRQYYQIGMQLPDSEIDYFGGGGFRDPQGKKHDQPDAYKNAVDKGYNYVNTAEDFNNLKLGDEKVLAVNPEKYQSGECYWDIDKKQGALPLADFTKKGIELLDNEKGFFMMVEGGKIDWACHINDAGSMANEVLDFNNAIKVAYDFYKKRPNETLIIVTADHETGGLYTGIKGKIKPQLLLLQKESVQEFATKIEQLKAQDTKPTFNTIMALVSETFGIGTKDLELTEEQLSMLKRAYKWEFDKSNKTKTNTMSFLSMYKNKSVAQVAEHILCEKAGVGWGSLKHTSVPVPVRVIGCGQQYFSKYFDNADIPTLIGKAMQIPETKTLN